MSKNCTEDETGAFFHLVDKYVMECATPNSIPDEEQEVSMEQPLESQNQCRNEISTQQKKETKKRGGDDDLPGRKEVKTKKTAIEKLDTILELGEGLKRTGEYTESARNFINKTILPVQNCFKNHHNSDKSLFLAKWGKQFPYSRFREKCSSSNTCINE
jgi:hypothetical protein